MFVIPNEIAIRENRLFVSDDCGHLWTAKLKRDKRAAHYNELRVEFIADLLGASTSLTIDPKGALYYYLPRDGALVRWNSWYVLCSAEAYDRKCGKYFRKPLNAENHDVLDLSSTRIVEILFGARGSVWAVKESSDYVDDHCKRILLHY